MKPAAVLDQRSSPRDREREKQRVQPGVVESFSDVTSRGQDEPLIVRRNCLKLLADDAAFPCAGTTV